MFMAGLRVGTILVGLVTRIMIIVLGFIVDGLFIFGGGGGSWWNFLLGGVASTFRVRELFF